MGLLRGAQTWGGLRGPPIFSRELYIIWSFGVYIHVYTHKPCLHGNFQTSPIFPCGAMTSFWSKMTSFRPKLALITKSHSFCKNGQVDLKIGQHTSFDA